MVFYLAKASGNVAGLWAELAAFWRDVASKASPGRQVELAARMGEWLADFRRSLIECDFKRLIQERRDRHSQWLESSDPRSAAIGDDCHRSKVSTNRGIKNFPNHSAK